jgi:hypothetical protein
MTLGSTSIGGRRFQADIMQIAGSTCSLCGKKIVFSQDGKGCPDCGIIVHQDCESQNSCAQCGRAYQAYEPPVVDAASEAVVPRSLRTSGTEVTIAILVLVVAIIFGLLVWFLG